MTLADAVPVSQLQSAWSAPAPVLVGAAVLLALFLQAWLRLRRRGRTDLAGWDRLSLFLLAVALGVLVLVSPLDPIGEDYLISAHMLQHVVLADLAPALAVVAVRGPLVFFLLPPAVLGPLARLRWLRAVLHAVTGPWVALGLWTLAMVAWHVPRAYDYVLVHPVVHDLEHLSFVVTGTLVWTVLVDPARTGRVRAPGRILFALGVFAVPHFAIEGLFLRATPSYPAYAAQPERLLGLSPVVDQHYAGALMVAEQILTLGVCVTILLLPYLKQKPPVEQPVRL